MSDDKNIVAEIKLPVGVSELAAIARALSNLHGEGKVFFWQQGQMLQFYTNKEPKP